MTDTRRLAGLWGIGLLVACAEPARAAEKDLLYEWFSVAVTVSGLPAEAPARPVSVPIDLGALLARAGGKGAVDERSLRLIACTPDGRDSDVPLQFVADEQPRAKERQFLSDTVPNVSYITEYAVGAAPPAASVRGTLWWLTPPDPRGELRYRLLFGVPRHGRAIQVPYPPFNQRFFDEAGRGTPLRGFPRMQIRPQWPLTGVFHVTDGGQPVTTYHVGPAGDAGGTNPLLRRPFCYPVHGPDGAQLTDLGKPHDPTASHRHHDSLWIAHARVAGHDFWSDQGGTIVHRAAPLLEDGPVFCRLVQQTRWRHGQTDCLDEQRSLTWYRSDGGVRLLDFDLQYQPAGAAPVELGQTSFGFLAVRVAQSMTPFDGGGEILNATGQRNEQQAHLRRARWIDQSGPTAADAWGGIAMLDHPQNAHHPTAWHCRNDGWAGASFNAERPYGIEPRKPLRLRYRVVLHTGNAAQAHIDGHWQAYAAEPQVRLGEPRRQEG
jgi:hypothetical protein